MKYVTRQYPLLSACGLNCGLCPRHYMDDTSKCPGCAGIGFSQVHPSCGVLSCCQRKGLDYCFLCDEYPCKKYDGADLSDSFISHKNQLKDFERAKQFGIDAYKTQLDEKIGLLVELLKTCDDGRRKIFFCLAVNLLDLYTIRSILEQLAGSVGSEYSLKAKAKSAVSLISGVAEKKGVSLKLRKKQNLDDSQSL